MQEQMLDVGCWMLVQKRINARADVGCWMIDVSWERKTAKPVIPAEAGIQVLPSFIPTCALVACSLVTCSLVHFADVSFADDGFADVSFADVG